jgi:DNA mismatch repair protein mutS
MAKTEKKTLMDQFFEIKEQYPDHIIFYRVGDFYEMFYEDAKTASEELDLTLTGKDCGKEERAPMCGVPYHSSDSYISRLIGKGYKIAICEQMDNKKDGSGLVRREVVRVITPGNVTDSNMLDSKSNNFLCSIFLSETDAGVCFIDASTGEIYVTEIIDFDSGDIINELSKFCPREILVSDAILQIKPIIEYIETKLNAVITTAQSVDLETASKTIANHFNVQTLKELNINSAAEVCALYIALSYIANTQKIDITFINKLNVYTKNQFMEIDLSTRRNLEIVSNIQQGKKINTLLYVLDKTKTSMGARKLKSFLERPLIRFSEIERRLNAVCELRNRIIERDDLRNSMRFIKDVERLMTKIMIGSSNARDLFTIKESLGAFPKIKRTLDSFGSNLIKDLNDNIKLQNEIVDLIDVSIREKTPNTITDGDIIKDGFDEDVDKFRNIQYNSKAMLANLEKREREKTGIKSLKVGYNRVFGYYIEVSKTYKDSLPEGYIRKQTLANAERYVTEELKNLEAEILTASDDCQNKEYEIFCVIRDKVRSKYTEIRTACEAVAYLDVLCTFAHVAQQNNYCRPVIDKSDVLKITEGRHPVVETVLKDKLFVPNDTDMDCNDKRVMLITGPNMSGKSTYMRQNAIIILMAQIGCFVPAKEAHIGIVDKLFSRIGASDDLTAGQSTFMVEMVEVAHIIKNATRHSFLIFDEIGRGTSTFDGMSIAQAVVEYVADKKKLGAKTMFATHYHELCALENTVSGLLNYNVAVKKRQDDIIFLNKIVRGSSDESYGIEVAALAGIDKSIITRARKILDDIESNGTVRVVTKEVVKSDNQISFQGVGANEIIEKLKTIDISTMTPIEAMELLNQLSLKAKE